MDRIKKFLFVNTNNKQTVIKNTFWLFTSEAMCRLLKMILVIFAARELGASGWGTFSYALSIGALLMIFSDIGIGNLITRELSQKKEGYISVVSTGIFLRNSILIISTILVIFISPFISQVEEARNLFPIIAIIFFFDSLRDLGFAINRASEKMEKEMLSKAVMSTVILILGIIFIKIKAVPFSIATAYAIGSAIGFLIIVYSIKNQIKEFLLKVDKKLLKTVFKTTLPFAIITLIGTIMSNTDIFMLGIWRDSTEIGFYSSAQRIQQFILIIPSMIATATFPLMSQIVKDGKEKFREILEKILSFVMLIGIPITFGGLIFSSQIIQKIFGNEYMDAIPILNILLIILIFSFPLIVLSNAIFSHNKQKDLVPAYGVGVILNIFLNILLIPKFGAIGSAVATLFSTMIITLIIWQKMKKINYFKIIYKMKKVIISTIFMVLSIFILKHFNINLFINIIFSSIIYFVSLNIQKEIILKEIREVVKI